MRGGRRIPRGRRTALAATLLLALAVLPGTARAQRVTLATDLPRVMVLLQEDGQLATALLTGFLREAGFTVLDPAFARTAMERTLAREALEGDETAATALGRDLGAHLLILGNAPTETAPNPMDDRLRVGTAEISVRALRLDEGRAVTSGSSSGRGVDATDSGAASRALRSAMERLLYDSAFLGDVVTDWEEVAWEDEAYWDPSPGSVQAQFASVGPGAEAAAEAMRESPGEAPPQGQAPLRLAILESRTYPDTAAERTRGIEVVGAQPSLARIRGVVTDPRARVTVAGKPARVRGLDDWEQESLGLTEPAAEFLADVPLPAGESRVRVAASGPTGSRTMEVSPAVSRRWAVIIGVSEYADDRIPALRYADDDAIAVHRFLRSEAGGAVPEDRIRLLLNEAATTEAIREALFVFLQQAGTDDLVTIYVAAHGAPDPARPDNLYLLPHDTDVDAMAATAFPMWDVKTALRRQIDAERVVVLADACRSAGTLGSGMEGGMDPVGNPVGGAFSDLFGPSRRLTLSASGTDEVSFEDARWGGGHGVFTYHLLRGLAGQADGDADGVVSFMELARYVQSRVRAETEGVQNPEWSGLGDVEMARVPAEGP